MLKLYISNAIGGFMVTILQGRHHSTFLKPNFYVHWNIDDAEMRRGMGMFPLAIIRTLINNYVEVT